MLIYLSGYLIILVEERYLWFVLILSIILGFYTLNMLYKERYLMKKNLCITYHCTDTVSGILPYIITAQLFWGMFRCLYGQYGFKITWD